MNSHQSLCDAFYYVGATTLVDLVVKAGLAETLSGPGPFTVVAPDNEAFAKLPADLVATLTGDVELLKKVLLFHVVPGMAVMRKDIMNNMVVPFLMWIPYILSMST